MYKIFLAITVTALCLAACGCSGGFGDDSAGANVIGPGIFGADSTYSRRVQHK
jgi:hypothetical protein